MKVLFAYKADGETDLYLAALPVGLGVMTAVLRQDGTQAQVANFTGDSWSQVRDFLAAEQPDLLALSVFTHNRAVTKRLAHEAKNVLPNCLVVCGGPHASHAVDELLVWPAVDGVVIGEGEEVVREIVTTIMSSKCKVLPQDLPGLVVSGAERSNQPRVLRAPIADLNALPFAHHGLTGGHGIDVRSQAEFIITSRGCPSKCSFCSSPGFWGSKIRFRSTESVVQELKSIHSELGLLYFSIRDDTFTADRQRAMDICQRIVAEKLYILWNCQSRVTTVDEELLGWMKRAGCECIQFGIESGAPRIIKQLGKQISLPQIRQAFAAARNVGLQVSVYLIAGVPGETAADIAMTEELLQELLPHDGQVSPLVYYPGTALFCDAVAKGEVEANLFATTADSALYVRTDREVRRTVQRLLACMKRVQLKAAYQRGDFTAQKARLGYCHATNLQAGEWFAAHEAWGNARREYEEILQREPENPWGWLAMGELSLMQNALEDAMAAFSMVHQLVPRHLPVLATLAELATAMGDRRQAKKWLELARQLSAC